MVLNKVAPGIGVPGACHRFTLLGRKVPKGSTMANQYSSELTEQRKVATKLLSRGYCTVSEIAAHYGLARQTVQVWARGIDISAARSAFIARAVRRASPRK